MKSNAEISEKANLTTAPSLCEHMVMNTCAVVYTYDFIFFL